MQSVFGKTSVITGGAGILGSEIAKKLVQEGSNVAICDLNGERLDILKTELDSYKQGKVMTCVCNVLDTGSLRGAAKKVIAEYSKIDYLINAAGGNSPLATTATEYFEPDSSESSFFSLPQENLQKIMDLNFFGTIFPSQVFTEYMLSGEEGAIINFSSMNAYTPLTKIPMYSAGKAAVGNFTQWFANYLAHTNIRVNAVAPGFFDTIQTRQLWYTESGEMLPRAKKILERTPMQRFGLPKELLGTILFLLDSEQSGFITGATIPVDGGFLAYTGV